MSELSSSFGRSGGGGCGLVGLAMSSIPSLNTESEHSSC